jgi:hypothetical protein
MVMFCLQQLQEEEGGGGGGGGGAFLQVLLANNIHNMCIISSLYIYSSPSFLPSFIP